MTKELIEQLAISNGITVTYDDYAGLTNIVSLKRLTKLIEAYQAQSEQKEAVTNLWEALGKWSAYLASNGDQANLAPPSWLIDAVSSATSPPKQATPDGWISVDDRLPEKSGEYLCVFYEWVGLKEQKPKEPIIAIKFFDKYWRKQQYFYDTGGYENLEVIYWMPLPPAPKLNTKD